MNDLHSLKGLKYLWNKRIVEIEGILGTTDFNFSDQFWNYYILNILEGGNLIPS